MMISSQLHLTAKQENSFDKFLVDGTERALSALDNMFGLDIDSSDSCIEIAPADNSEILKHLGNGTLYTVTSSMVGGMQGKMLVLMRSSDFNHLSKAMKPILNLLFWSGTETDLAANNGQKKAGVKNSGTAKLEDADFQEQMIDTLGEIANVFFGLYAKAIYKISNLNTSYSLPKALKDTDQQVIRQFLSSSDVSDQIHLVIQNEFYVMDKPIKLWYLISPTQKSFRNILKRIECHDVYH